MTIRLTSSIRDIILANVKAQAFGSEFAELEQQDLEIGRITYAKLYNAEQVKMAKKLGAQWVRHADSIHVEVYSKHWEPSEDEQRYKDRIQWKLPLVDSLPIDVDACYGRVKLFDRQIHSSMVAWRKRRDDLDTRLGELVGKTREVILSASTVEKLLVVWPGVKQFLPEIKPPAPAQLPAVQVGDLNKMLRKAGVTISA